MFSTRLCSSNKIFKNFFLIKEPQNEESVAVVLKAFPAEYNQAFANKTCEFAFPCKCPITEVEEYTIIFTDGDGNLEFVVCRYLPSSGLCLCIYSSHPWFDLLHNILTSLSQQHLYEEENRHLLDSFLDRLQNLSLPPPGETVYLPTCEAIIARKSAGVQKFIVPDTNKPEVYSKYLMEFYNAMDKEMWMEVFFSLLRERRIVFHAKKLRRLTSCILAVTAMLYPLNWAYLFYPILSEKSVEFAGCPSPFVAGVHTCLMDRVMPLLVEGTRIIDLNKGECYVIGDNVDVMPKVLRRFMRRKWKECEDRASKGGGGMMDNAGLNFVPSVFLQTMVALLGNYRKVLTSREKVGIVVDREAFSLSRGPFLQPFLKEMLETQMLQQFLEGREKLLNSGEPYDDAFEKAARDFNVRELNAGPKANEIVSAVRSKSRQIRVHGTEKLASLTSKVRDLRKRKGHKAAKSAPRLSRSESDPALQIHQPNQLEEMDGTAPGSKTLQSGLEGERAFPPTEWTLITDTELNSILQRHDSWTGSLNFEPDDSRSGSPDSVQAITPIHRLPPPRPTSGPHPPPRPSNPPPDSPLSPATVVPDRERTQTLEDSEPRSRRETMITPPDRSVPLIPPMPREKKVVTTSVIERPRPRPRGISQNSGDSGGLACPTKAPPRPPPLLPQSMPHPMPDLLDMGNSGDGHFQRQPPPPRPEKPPSGSLERKSSDDLICLEDDEFHIEVKDTRGHSQSKNHNAGYDNFLKDLDPVLAGNGPAPTPQPLSAEPDLLQSMDTPYRRLMAQQGANQMPRAQGYSYPANQQPQYYYGGQAPNNYAYPPGHMQTYPNPMLAHPVQGPQVTGNPYAGTQVFTRDCSGRSLPSSGSSTSSQYFTPQNSGQFTSGGSDPFVTPGCTPHASRVVSDNFEDAFSNLKESPRGDNSLI